LEIIEENQDKEARDIDENKEEECQSNVWSIVIP